MSFSSNLPPITPTPTPPSMSPNVPTPMDCLNNQMKILREIRRVAEAKPSFASQPSAVTSSVGSSPSQTFGVSQTSAPGVSSQTSVPTPPGSGAVGPVSQEYKIGQFIPFMKNKF